MSALEIVGAIALYIVGGVALSYAVMWAVLLFTPKHWGLVSVALAGRAMIVVAVIAVAVGLVLLGMLLGGGNG